MEGFFIYIHFMKNIFERLVSGNPNAELLVKLLLTEQKTGKKFSKNPRPASVRDEPNKIFKRNRR